MDCPMSINVPLTEGQIKYFCSQGCSSECDKFLEEYIKRVKKE